MEIISSVGLVAAPFLIKWITAGVKKIGTIKYSENKTFILRGFVALLSITAAVVTALIDHTQVSTSVISSFVDAVLVFISSTGLYFWGKNKTT